MLPSAKVSHPCYFYRETDEYVDRALTHPRARLCAQHNPCVVRGDAPATLGAASRTLHTCGILPASGHATPVIGAARCRVAACVKVSRRGSAPSPCPDASAAASSAVVTTGQRACATPCSCSPTLEKWRRSRADSVITTCVAIVRMRQTCVYIVRVRAAPMRRAAAGSTSTVGAACAVSADWVPRVGIQKMLTACSRLSSLLRRRLLYAAAAFATH